MSEIPLAAQAFNHTYDPVCEMWIKADNYEELESFDFRQLNRHQVAWIVAGLCTLVSIALSLVLIVNPLISM